MLHYIEEFHRYVEITGYRSVAFTKAEAFLKANRRQNRQNVDIQFFDADLIATQEHLYFAAVNALQAFQNKTNISKSLAMETMLYASAQRQIQKSIDCIGIKPESKHLAVTIIGQDPKHIEIALKELTEYLGVEPDGTVLELTDQKQEKIRKAFQITTEELKATTRANVDKAIVDLVVEHVALLSTQL